MNHEQARRACSLDLDGDLSPAKLAELQAHLMTCRLCRHYSAQLESCQAMLASHMGRAHAGLHESILHMIRCG